MASNAPLPRWLAGWRWSFMQCGSQAQHSIPHSAPRCDNSNSELTVFVRSSLVESRCPCRDVGEVIPVGSLRPIRTACKTLGGRTFEHPSCGGFMPTAETTLFPASGNQRAAKRFLTSDARLDNEPNPGLTARRGHTNRNYGANRLTHSGSAAITTHFRV